MFFLTNDPFAMLQKQFFNHLSKLFDGFNSLGGKNNLFIRTLKLFLSFSEIVKCVSVMSHQIATVSQFWMDTSLQRQAGAHSSLPAWQRIRPFNDHNDWFIFFNKDS